MFKSLAKSIEEFLQKLADQNKEQFGTARMDCCDVNRKPILKK